MYRSFAEKSAQAQGAGDKTAAASEPEDRVEISREASDMQQARELSSRISTGETTEERQTRIADIKDRIESGRYQVDSADVARSMLLGGKIDLRA